MDICLATDDNYAKYCATTIYSAIKNKLPEDNLTFHIIHGGLSENNIEKLKQLGDIRFYFVDDNYFAGLLRDKKQWSSATLYRLKSASILDLDKVLYVDCDLIIKESLSELWNTNIDNYYIAGVPDAGQEESMNRLKIKNDGKHFYFNAGVSYLNLKKIREDGMEEKMLDYLENNYKILIFNDQDVLNYIFQDNALKLDKKFNYLPFGTDTRKDIQRTYLQDAVIVHFAGCKPWDKAFIVNCYEEEFWEYLKNTNFMEQDKFEELYNNCKIQKNKFNRIIKFIKTYPLCVFRLKQRKRLFDLISDIDE